MLACGPAAADHLTVTAADRAATGHCDRTRITARPLRGMPGGLPGRI
jgi:hypothetical protein